MFWGGSSYFSDKMFDQYEWEGSAFEDSSKINNFADVTPACEDGQHEEEHKEPVGSDGPASQGWNKLFTIRLLSC